MRLAVLPLLVLFVAHAPTLAHAQDADRGAALFKRICSTCHQVAQPRSLAAPHLIGIVGRKIGSVEGFAYSQSFKATDGVWDETKLNAYIANPGEVIKGTKMIIKVPSETDRTDIVAYLATVK
jgi:cytochrome c